MAKTINKIVLIFLLFVLSGNISFSQDEGYLEVRAKILSNKVPQSEAKVRIIKNDKLIKNILTDNKGDVIINLPYNSNYTLEFSKEGLATKSIKFDSHVPEKEKSLINFFEFKLDLFHVVDSLPKGPIAGIHFDSRDSMFNYDELLHFNIGINCFDQKEFKSAIINFDHAIKSNIKIMDSFYNRGLCYKMLGNDSAACEDWLKTKKLGGEEAEELLSKYCKKKTAKNFYTDSNIGIIYVGEIKEMPIFANGGDKALSNFLHENLIYPKEAIENRFQGIVYATFIVDLFGNVKNVKLLRGIGNGCDEEALRLINIMPTWIPGKVDGNPVNFQYDLPIVFTIKD